DEAFFDQIDGEVASESAYNKLWGVFHQEAQRTLARNPNAAIQDVADALARHQAFKRLQKSQIDFFLNYDLELDFAADANQISMHAALVQGRFEGDDAILPEGYDRLVENLAQGLDIQLSQQVSKIQYNDDGVTVNTQAQTYTGDYVLITVPLGVLKRDLIQFTPNLPEHKVAAIQGLEMGVLNKVYLQFPQVFWQENLQNIARANPQKGEWTYWINLKPATNAPILCGFNAGSFGIALEDFSDDAIIEQAMAALRSMYGDAIPAPTNYLITRWARDPFTYGAYSFVPQGKTVTLRDDLASPIQHRLFFAGEATSRVYSATVHGAYLSGARESNRLINLALGEFNKAKRL
ncbi:MAG: FAD-dependent oxidoreductase, partial [Pseudomonadota bacterium]